MTSDALSRRQAELDFLAQDLWAGAKDSPLCLIYPHIRADGDAYGASMALALAMEKIGYKAEVLLEEPLIDQFSYLPGQELLKIWPKLKDSEKEELQTKQVLAIMVDLSTPDRLGKRRDLYESAPKRLILDHHLSRLENDTQTYIFPDAAASCELIYDTIKSLEKASNRTLLDKDIAVSLYSGLLTDTGAYSYNSVTPHTLEVGADLIRQGIDFPRLNSHLLKEVDWQTFYVEGLLRAQVQELMGGKVRYLSVTKKMMQDMKAKDEDLEAMPGAMRDIKGCLLSLMLRETLQGQVRGNLRSENDVDVRLLAEKFGGGGHKNAAGFTLEDMTLAQAQDPILAEVEAYLTDYLESHA